MPSHMRPVEVHFLDDYLAEINTDTADIIFGGFTVPKQKQSNETELHRAFSKTSDCLTAEERNENGAQYVLLV